jgi:DNA-binding sugar fermentation-stimulating protein
MNQKLKVSVLLCSNVVCICTDSQGQNRIVSELIPKKYTPLCPYMIQNETNKQLKTDFSDDDNYSKAFIQI